MMRLANARFWRVLAVAATMWSCTETLGQERPPVLTGPRFKAELDKPISIARDSITHEGAELRPLLQRVASERGVAFVLDRRVDPSRRIDLELPPFRLRDALAKIAAEADCLCTVAGDTVFIGPRDGTGKLRTLIALRETELDQPATQPGWRELELRRAWTFAWDDLDGPADLVLIAAQHWTLQVEGLDQVPHDLWAAGTLAGVNAVEALSVLLVQFDLTFEWTADRTGVRIVPIPDTVAITRSHTVRRITAARALERIRELYPKLHVQMQGRELVATGTVEEQDVVARLARGESPNEPDPQPVDFGPLRRRRFTIQVVSRPVEAVLQTLAGNGIDVRYDADQLKTMGIDLSKQISFDLKEATVEELFGAICLPVGLRFTVEGDAVTLSPE
jgi:hypothetical protein